MQSTLLPTAYAEGQYEIEIVSSLKELLAKELR